MGKEWGIHACKNLQVLYLNENKLPNISDLMLKFTKLTRLSLHNNRIAKIENLDALVNLQKLYLDQNRIRCLEGLQHCTRLEELELQNQNLPRSVRFTFDEYTLAAISSSLTRINLASTNVKDCRQLYFCDKLEFLDLRDNFIEDLNDQVMPLLQTMARLNTLDLRDNQVQLEARYREHIIMESRSLRELDGKAIRDQDRRYLFALA